jgi:hypothetical protein
MPRIEDLVTLAAEATIEAAGTQARADRLKAAAIAEAERLRAEHGLTDRFPSDQGRGILRLDGAGKPPAAQIDKPAEFADWLAQRSPGEVVATIRVRADQLGDAIEHLDFAGVAVVESKVAPGERALDWLRDHSVIHADPDHAGAWNVIHVDADGHTGPVPGVSVDRPRTRWVLTADPGLKQRRAAEEVEVAEALLGSEVARAAVPAPRDGAAEDLAGLKVSELRSRCRDAELSSSGTKAELVQRLTERLGSR